eukprot:12132029-Alexandrium_andersonii.AAC.1
MTPTHQVHGLGWALREARTLGEPLGGRGRRRRADGRGRRRWALPGGGLLRSGALPLARGSRPGGVRNSHEVVSGVLAGFLLLAAPPVFFLPGIGLAAVHSPSRG